MRHEAVEEVEIMDEVPQIIRKSISLQINLPLFEKLGLFHDFPISLQTAIAGMMYPLQVCSPPKCCQGSSRDYGRWGPHLALCEVH